MPTLPDFSDPAVRCGLLVQPLLPLLEQAVAAADACAARLQVSFDLRSAVGEVHVALDAQRITQAFVALLSYAASLAPAGGVVEVRLQRNAAMVRVAVFVHAGAAADDGAALAPVRSTVEQHHGTLGLNGKPGVRTEFYADLPLAVAPRKI